jgi:hypothetical protein
MTEVLAVRSRNRRLSFMCGAGLGALVAVVTVGSASLADTQQTEHSRPHVEHSSSPVDVARPFVLLQVGDHLEVVRRDELKEFQERLNENYVEALKQHRLASEAARRARQWYGVPRPVRPRQRIIPGNFESAEEAQVARERIVHAAEQRARALQEAAHRAQQAEAAHAGRAVHGHGLRPAHGHAIPGQAHGPAARSHGTPAGGHGARPQGHGVPAQGHGPAGGHQQGGHRRQH